MGRMKMEMEVKGAEMDEKRNEEKKVCVLPFVTLHHPFSQPSQVCAITNAASDLGIYSYYVGLLTLLLLLVVLGFFAHLLDNVIDTVYVCYAIDRDRGDVSKPDVHEVYVHLPISRSQRSSLISRTLLNV
ncbi:hypothetical protein Droror1_Dr00020954 [Drosera rotundifolia]